MINFNNISPLPDMPIVDSSNLAAKKDMMSKIWTNGETIISKKHCGERRNWSLRAIFLFPQYFQRLSATDASK